MVRTLPKERPTDEWPTFELRDATILRQDGETMENGLFVGTKGPFIVRGTLIIDDAEQKSHRESCPRCPMLAAADTDSDTDPRC